MKKLKKGIEDFKRGFKETSKDEFNIPEEQKWKKDGGDDPPLWFMIPMFLLIVIVGFYLLTKFIDSKPIDKAKGFLDDRSDKKEYCAERAEDASNSYAAKKIYKACMSNNQKAMKKKKNKKKGIVLYNVGPIMAFIVCVAAVFQFVRACTAWTD